ncbi:MAG: asparagine synthase (glutamine-hydrolyzing) [Candidatus Omnitrophica bacterium CG11_big_fil_rev_8_21_14_0_20_45_26]|uniref:asparagine synthase (glutamine-hydrolyzing) n=1 Tax=Candidatus Abzuiibacterium crystallinum TaxID=1974748 RepID=A0A2H0LQY1_9BACT|nr:MAG: asparagine synthase (glutamine-hydrolyzing) [Candidatus Omnitrophica bacterium CG11_big_fil_rev_8_21_14_0_20_45_26]PIW64670.1 MAG: asparagine synthase (glutamine-hydrolyzing) [Candidatus Omnitrophica bacterium CG12_big_fil_rev_8_21_14_0_65_45_16]
MCGIAGIAGRQKEGWVARMYESMRHRGPDDTGEFHHPSSQLALGMSRLSVIDVKGGHQPMGNLDETLWIVFNGEIYNAGEIRKRLMSKGFEFRTSHSDTEVLLHAYADQGPQMLKELNGMFAFVIFDKRKNALFGARDRIGIKPFYYLEQPERFIFASELKAILTLPCVEREIDTESLYHYFTLLYVPGESSIIQKVKRLLPGHFFTYDLEEKQFQTQSYWSLDFKNQTQWTAEEWSGRIRDKLTQAVKRRLISDVPVGFSLSGGIDSSGLVGLAAEVSTGPVKTYSLGFKGEREEVWNELPLAKVVAERWSTEHHELTLSSDELLEDLVQMVYALDEPYGGGLPSWYVFRFMSKTVKVGISGTGGDELFGNYGKFRRFEQSCLAPFMKSPLQSVGLLSGLRAPVLSMLDLLRENRFRQRLKKKAEEWLDFGYGALSRYYVTPLYYATEEMKQRSIFQDKGVAGFNTRQALQTIFDQNDSPSFRNQIAALDFKTQLADEFLLMTDRLSMAHSLEARVPYLDHEFVELVMSIPPHQRTQSTNLKYLLKKSLAHVLPTEICGAHKRGFVIPIGLWLRTRLKPLAERLTNPERLGRQNIFQPAFYQQFVKPHLEGKADYTWQIWSMVMFQLWHMIYIENQAVGYPTFSVKELSG